MGVCVCVHQLFPSTRSHKQRRDKSSWSFWKRPAGTRERYMKSECSHPNTEQMWWNEITCTLSCYCEQQLEQLQKELNFLEDDIKRVEVTWRRLKEQWCQQKHWSLNPNCLYEWELYSFLSRRPKNITKTVSVCVFLFHMNYVLSEVSWCVFSTGNEWNVLSHDGGRVHGAQCGGSFTSPEVQLVSKTLVFLHSP